MQILDFDNINKYQEVRTWLMNQTPSQLMEKKVQAVNVVWDLLEYLYMLGFTSAKEEVGEIAEYAKPFLPDDYVDGQNGAVERGTSTSGEARLNESSSSSPSNIPSSTDSLTAEQQKVADMSIFRKFDGKDFTDRVREYAELGSANEILRVVETDGNRVYNTGGVEGARSVGATSKTWRTMLDDRVRDTHDYLEGITVGIDEKFYTYDGDSARYPGDFEMPENSINCRCFLEFK